MNGFAPKLGAIIWIFVAIVIGKGIKSGKSEFRKSMSSQRHEIERGKLMNGGAMPKALSSPKAPIASKAKSSRISSASKGYSKSKGLAKAKPYNLLALEDRENDWLALQLREEKRLAKRGPFSTMNGGEHGAARLNKLLHEASCDAESLRAAHTDTL